MSHEEHQTNTHEQNELNDTVEMVKSKIARHLTELGMTPTDFTDDYLQELRDEGYLKLNGVAFGAHNEPVTDEQVIHTDNATQRLEGTQTEIATYLDQNKILTIVINPKIN